MMSDSSPSSDSEKELGKPPETTTQIDAAHDAAHDADAPEKPDWLKPRNPNESAATNPDDEAETIEIEDRMVGEFRLLRRLGRGGMADVYLAEQTSLKRQVALKILRDDQLSKFGEILLKRFEREAKAAAGLNHPHIVQVYSVGEVDGVHFIAQEYVQGQTLRQYLNRKGPPALPIALRIMKQVATALQEAAQAGIVHRDIKPENIMLTRKGEVKVADFGLARLMQPEEHVDLTQFGMTMGTPSYMSPEQVNGEEIDQRTDIYSLGVTCYHMLVGKPPFRGETALSIAVQHVNDAPVPMSELREDLPPVLCEIVHKMINKRPDDRYPDAKTLLEDIGRLTETMTQQPEATEQLSLSQFETSRKRTKKPGRVWRQIGSRQSLVFLLSFLLVGSASAGVGWLMRPRDPFQTPVSEKFNVQKKRTAAAQYALAMRMVDNEDAWQAVIDFFGDDDNAVLEVRRAEEKLALVHVRKVHFDKAKKLFKKLAILGSESGAFRANAYAGLAGIASLEGDFSESQQIIENDLLPAIRQLRQLPPPNQLDPQMQGFVQRTIARNGKHLREKFNKDIDDLFERAISNDELP